MIRQRLKKGARRKKEKNPYNEQVHWSEHPGARRDYFLGKWEPPSKKKKKKRKKPDPDDMFTWPSKHLKSSPKVRV